VTVMENFNLALQVTAIGMALVFLSLLIVMFVIYALDRIFRVKSEEDEDVATGQAPQAAFVTGAAATAGAVAVPAGPSANEAAAVTLAVKSKKENEAAAIAVAIALAAQSRGGGNGQARAVSPIERFLSLDSDEEILGEVVTVNFIETSPGTWKQYGRMKAMS
jgi:Na+-transporting methylmalonyl-CoA/oxaloacetate decarboxylase gamma subunit